MMLCVYLLQYVDDIVLGCWQAWHTYSEERCQKRFSDFLTAALPIDDRGELRWMLRMEIPRRWSPLDCAVLTQSATDTLIGLGRNPSVH